MSALLQLATMLGVAPRLAEDALHSESAARAVLSRRNLFVAGAALAVGSSLTGGPLPLQVFHDGCTWYAAHSWADYRDVLADQGGISEPYLEETIAESEECELGQVMNVCWDPVAQEMTDHNQHTKRASLDFWARREGRGILFGTEY